MDPDDGPPGKNPPAPSLSRQPMTLLLCKTRDRVRIEGGNPDLGWADDDWAVIDPDIN
jgi:hypothetical protein